MYVRAFRRGKQKERKKDRIEEEIDSVQVLDHH